MDNLNITPVIAVLPYGKWKTFNLSKVSLDELEWPLGRPERLRGCLIKDLSNLDHLLTFPRKVTFILPRPYIKAKISLIIAEPDAVHQKYLNWSQRLSWRFYKILTKNQTLLSSINNGLFYYFGSTFISNIESVDFTKIKMTSLIASARNELKGHKLRHQIVSEIRSKTLDVDIMGRGYKPFDKKEDGLASYCFSVIIENVKERDYFTEKIVDACLCETIPIYWGCPNIEDYFDIKGIIVCNTAEEIMEALLQINQSFYNSKAPWIRHNKESALLHADYIKRAALAVKESLD